MIPTGANEKRAVPQIGRYTAGVLNRGLKLRLLGWMPRKDLVPVARSTKLAGKPASSEVPVSPQRGSRDIQRFRCFGFGQTAEEAQLDHLGGARIQRF